MANNEAAAGDIVDERHGRPYRRVQRDGWTLEVRGDEVADIGYGGVSLLRAVRPVVCDRDWNTVPVRVVSHRVEETAEALTLVADLRFEGLGIAYAALLSVRMRKRELTVDFAGRALADLDRNRIGLVVLHRADDAGTAVRVRHADGTVSEGRWPTEISPHQPFREVQGFEWTREGVTAALALDGDTFETEDQRNWTDASFKTYSTPLSLPFPVRIETGEECQQSARLTVTGTASARDPQPSEAADHVLVTAEVVSTVPPISLGAALYPEPPAITGHAGAYDGVLVELTGPADRWADHLAAAAEQARALSAGLDIRVVAGSSEEVERAVDLLALLPVIRLGVYDPVTHITTAPLWDALRGAVARRDLSAQLVGGTRAHFTELNRQLGRIPRDIPALTFSLTPQMHASEIPHIIDSLAMQQVVAENARRLAGGRPVLVGPITLARRFNAVATSGPADPARAAEAAVDLLQPTGFTAAWTLGSVAALAAGGVAAVSYFETGGPRGVGADGTLTPTGEVLRRLAGWRGREVLAATAPADLAVLASRSPGGSSEVLLGNLSARRRRVTVRLAEVERQIDLAPWGLGRASLDG